MRNLWALLLSLLLSACADGLFYFPDHHVYSEPDRYQDIYFQSKDGTRLHAWLLPSAGPRTLGTVVHFHGNAQNLSAHVAFVDWLTRYGYEVFTFDYRGYGQSGGSPSRQGIHADAMAALDYVAERTDPARIVVFGQSLGAAIALDAVTSDSAPRVAAVVLDSGFASYRGIARDKLKQVPLVSALRSPLAVTLVSEPSSPVEAISHLHDTPVLIVHGTEDPVVPYSHAQQLYEAAHEPKTLWTVEGGRHTEAFARFRSIYRPLLGEFLKKALARRQVQM